MRENSPIFFDGLIVDLWLCWHSFWTPAWVIDSGFVNCTRERNAIDDSGGTVLINKCTIKIMILIIEKPFDSRCKKISCAEYTRTIPCLSTVHTVLWCRIILYLLLKFFWHGHVHLFESIWTLFQTKKQIYLFFVRKTRLKCENNS